MIQSGWYDDLETEVDGATQKKVNEDLNAINCRALKVAIWTHRQQLMFAEVLSM